MQRGAVTSTAPRRGGPRPEAVRAGVFVGGLALAGLAAALAGSVAGSVQTSAATTAVRLVLLVAGAVVGGLGLVHPLAGGPGSDGRGVAGAGVVQALAGGRGTGLRRVAWVAGLLAAAAALAGYLHGDVGRAGTLAWVVAALLVPSVLETRFARSGWPVAVAALPVTALVAVTFGSAHTGAAFAADAVHTVASAVLLGTLALRALPGGPGPLATPDPVPDQDVRAVRPRSNSSGVLVDDPSGPSGAGPAAAPGRPVLLPVVGAVAAATGVLAGVARIVTAGPYSVTDLVGTAYGRTALVAVVLPALAGVVLLKADAARRGDPSPHAGGGGVPHRAASSATGGVAGAPLDRHGVLAGAAGVVALGVAAAAVAGLLPVPAPAAVPGQALMRTVALDGATVPVVIAPMRPGPNLVQLGGSGYSAAAGATAPGQATASGGANDGSVHGGSAHGGMAGHDAGGAAGGSAGLDGGGSTAGGSAGHDGSGGAAGGSVGHGGAAGGEPGSGSSGHDMTGHAGPATVAAGGDPVPFLARPAARGGWAVVDVPAGTSSVTIEMNGDSATVPVDVGDTPGDAPSSALAGPDGPECVSALVGTALGGGVGTVRGCPSQTFDPEQAQALRSTVATMAAKGARSVRLVSDASPRSVAAARVVRDEGARAGLAFADGAENDPNSALVVVSGWDRAVAVLGEAGQRSRTTPTHLGGTFLAPWLLTGDVLRQTASAFLPLSFAPNEPDAQRYALALAATHPDTAPSASGYLAWAAASGVPADPRPSLYGAAAVNVPMSVEPQGSSGHHGGPDPAAWYPGGTVVPVSPPMEGS